MIGQTKTEEGEEDLHEKRVAKLTEEKPVAFTVPRRAHSHRPGKELETPDQKLSGAGRQPKRWASSMPSNNSTLMGAAAEASPRNTSSGVRPQ